MTPRSSAPLRGVSASVGGRCRVTRFVGVADYLDCSWILDLGSDWMVPIFDVRVQPGSI